MSGNYYIQATVKTPEIKIDTEARVMEMRGRSLPEDAIEFYNSAIIALDEALSANDSFTLKFYLEYLNTSSSSIIRSIMELAADAMGRPGRDYIVQWYFEEDDLEMEEMGKHYEQTIPGLEIEYHEVDSI